MITIALCLSTLNDGDNLDLSLKRLVGIVDEVFIIDKGSNDDSVKKSALFTNNIFNASNDNYGLILSNVLKKVQSQYILYMNGDEYFSYEDIEKLKVVKEVYSDNVDYIKFDYIIDEDTNIMPSLKIKRLVKREKALGLKSALFENLKVEGVGVNTDIKLRKNLREDSLNIEEIYDTPLKILIGSYICEDKNVLAKFLDSLLNLDKEGLSVDYYFIDDNIDSDSKDILSDFKEKQINSKIFDVELCENTCLCPDENILNEELDDRIIRFKNKIIDYARISNYDYLLMVDSNIRLYPKSLDSLINTRKDIVSNILWSKCNSEEDELPQVWLKDGYNLYETNISIPLTEEEKEIEKQAFLDLLRKPGCYRVGGVGACILLSRRSLIGGCNFNKLYNISSVNDDVYFSLRAAVLGFEMFVDTNYPAHIIYNLL